ncbi:MAG: hypothetical protein ACLUOI_16135 [Eisenbergiella sp.]
MERPGKAADAIHNMRGEIIDNMIADSSPSYPKPKAWRSNHFHRRRGQ